MSHVGFFIFSVAVSRLINGGPDPNYLLSGMILQVAMEIVKTGGFFRRNHHSSEDQQVEWKPGKNDKNIPQMGVKTGDFHAMVELKKSPTKQKVWNLRSFY